jgi:prepilin-type processing-associated H-X9-DG protein
MNAFRFDLRPRWDPAGPARLGSIRNASSAIWLAEAADLFGDVHADDTNHIYLAQYHDSWLPEHLPGGRWTHISDDRHGESANVLRFDGSIHSQLSGTISIDQFDVGLAQQAPPVLR